MTSASKQLEVRTGPPAREESTPRLPHERDESEDSQTSGVRPDIKQAFDDLQDGQMDTDLRGMHGVDEVVQDTPVPTPEKVLDEKRGANKK